MEEGKGPSPTDHSVALAGSKVGVGNILNLLTSSSGHEDQIRSWPAEGEKKRLIELNIEQCNLFP